MIRTRQLFSLRYSILSHPRTWTRQFTSTSNYYQQKKTNDDDPDHPSNSPPIVGENGLYYNQFTKQEYENASKIIQDQIKKLELQIKGDYNIRENIGKMPQFPAPSTDVPIKTKVENLTDFFIQTIKLTGPISLSAYMRQCLTHPEFGYYTTRDPLDSQHGDFITSPEISSVFGEMIGVWYFSIWQTQKCPNKIRFIEFGPGRGTLMHDILVTFNRLVKRVQKDIESEILMIEASNVLRREQWKLLCGEENQFGTTEEGYNVSVTKWGNGIKWLDTEKDIKHTNEYANYIIAHEFFDALPIKSFIRKEQGWRELVVEHSSSVTNTQPKLEGTTPSPNNPLLETEFHLTTSPKETPSSIIPTISSRYRSLPIGSRIEICPDAELYIMKMIQLLNNTNGAVLIIDYGLINQIPENSLRGIHKHKFVSPFILPGQVDLSIDVDFDNLSTISQGLAQVYGPVKQGDWLHNIGIGYRIDQLLKKNQGNEEVEDKIYGAYKRLTDEGEMGGIYKFLALLPKGSEKPIGF
ncbi:uncharacterized protein J8A68_005540 [[Candida] subhashii]|uniref:Protein arginine methyltransferase NDUFAF7 n=1 Tax=[Candida] subhashii TaxID=561895 RepID=A0A8J5QGK4_9ASCO|nr:uncharacterized protein J8A68_005540 [[Candida] subhashii]KAG7661020.1 hypothetical protein J8A68_005540 [[Candida] subhashii]